MSWNYQIVEHHEEGKRVWFGLHEVYRLKEGSTEITGVTKEPAAVGNTQDELIQTVATMLGDAIQRPLVVDRGGTFTELESNPWYRAHKHKATQGEGERSSE